MSNASGPKWALVTGCSEGGIGEALCRAFSDQGFKVIATARNTAKMSETLKSRSNVEVLELDVNSGSSVSAAVESVTKLANGRWDFLVNNSGISYYTPILDVDLDRARDTFETNVISWIRVTKAFFPLLRQAQGTIVNNASCGGCDSSYLPFGGVYNSSKSAAAKLSQTLRLELAPLGVKVITLYPGGLETHIWDNMKAAQVNTLRDDSLYQPISKEATNILSGAFITNSPLESWAQDVVSKAKRQSPPLEIWTGAMAGTLWWMNFLAPRWMMDKIFNDQCGLAKLKQRLPPT